MSNLLDLYGDVVDAQLCLESALAALNEPGPDEGWKALDELADNVRRALELLKIPGEITAAVAAEEAMLYDLECRADAASY